MLLTTNRQVMLHCNEIDGCVGAYRDSTDKWIFVGGGECGLGICNLIVPRNDMEEIHTSCSTDSNCVGFDKDGGMKAVVLSGGIPGGGNWTSHQETGTFLKVDQCGEKGSAWCEDTCVYVGGECFDDATSHTSLAKQDFYISPQQVDENFRKKQDLLVIALYNSYTEFDTSNLNMMGSDDRLFLVLYVTDMGEDSNLNVYLAYNDFEHRWDEQTMMFNNNPTSEGQQSLNTLDGSEAKVHTWVDVDITDLYSAMIMTIILSETGNRFGFSSSEDYGSPKLIVMTSTVTYV